MKQLKLFFLFIGSYIILVMITLPFLMIFSWGKKLNFIEKSFLFFTGKPFRLDTTLFNLIPNSIFWGVLLYLLTWVVKYLGRGK
ncbi:MAG: hypothetical protein RLZZ628_2157 [Bacteroidota bacterium]